MPPKKSGRALAREEGLERTDNSLPVHSWPVIPMINQKNYYTEYLKRDDQFRVLREQGEETERAEAERQQKRQTNAPVADDDAAEKSGDDEDATEDERKGAKVIVIHPGSQNLRLGFASDVVPKTMPMVIARRGEEPEFMTEERSPKRVKVEKDQDGDVAMGDDGAAEEEEEELGEVERPPEWDTVVDGLATDLKRRMRANKHRVLPNSKDLVLSFNRRAVPEKISEHNDVYRADWTDIGDPPREYFVGYEALKVPDVSSPPYRAHWPIRYGSFNERDARYKSKRRLLEDIETIITSAIKTELSLDKSKFKDYRCVLIIPDLYEKNYVIQMIELLLNEMGFSEVCFIQESVAATYGAGWSMGCIIDIGAQKTSICCVEEGMCVADSRINLKTGGYDITETQVRMLLLNSFPYASANLNKRHEFLQFEDLKTRIISLNEADVILTGHDLFIRSPGADTLKYPFRTNDEVYLPPYIVLFSPATLDHSHKLLSRRSVWPRSIDIYDSTPNDPLSSAQISIFQSLSTGFNPDPPPPPPIAPSQTDPTGTPARFPHLTAPETPLSTGTGSPVPDGFGGADGAQTPSNLGFPDTASNPGGTTGLPGLSPAEIATRMWDEYDTHVPIAPLDQAIIDCISHAAKGDEKKMRDYLQGILVLGGGGKIPGIRPILEEKIRGNEKIVAMGRGEWGGDMGGGTGMGGEVQVIVGAPPREIDAREVVWKGASVFGKLSIMNDAWIRWRDWDLLGSRLLTVKALWNF